jgi:hypothetical protein
MPQGKEKQIREPQYRNTDNHDWDINMQNPDTIYRILRELNEIMTGGMENWPDRILLSQLPQVDEKEADADQKIILGISRGIVRHRAHTIYELKETTVIIKRPEQTQYVRVHQYGQDWMEVYDPEKHGPITDIPDIGMTPQEIILKQILSIDQQIEEAEQFKNLQKHAAASHPYYKSRTYVPPEIRKKPRKGK